MAAVLGMPYLQRYVHDIDAAVDWLGWSSRFDALRAAEEAAALAREAMGVSATVQRLQNWLESSLEHATVDEAAAALGLSSRTLQRELRDAGTSFTCELRRVRMCVACQLLVETEHKNRGHRTRSRLLIGVSADPVQTLDRRNPSTLSPATQMSVARFWPRLARPCGPELLLESYSLRS